MRAEIDQVVTFASGPFEGNPAFVVSADEAIPPELLQKVAAQLATQVIAVLRPIDAVSSALGFFTPSGPHRGAGHVALAAAHLTLTRLGADTATLVLANGTVETFRRNGLVSVPWDLMPGTPVDKVDELARALRLRPLRVLEAPFGYVAVYDDPAEVAGLVPDLEAVARLDRGAAIATAPGETSDFVVRVFAPRLDLPEDPVCGTAHRILAPYWAARLGRNELHSRHLSPRGGDLWCRVLETSVQIAGMAYTFLSGTIVLP